MSINDDDFMAYKVFRNITLSSNNSGTPQSSSVCETVEDEDQELSNFDQILKFGKLEGFSYQNNSHEQQCITFLGVKFLVKNLQERNNNPMLLLRAVLLTYLVQTLLGSAVFLYGTNFNLVFSIIYPVNVGVYLFIIVYSLKVSVEQFKGAPRRIQIMYRLVPLTNISLVMFGFFKVTPFGKKYIFIICIFFVIFCASFLISMIAVRSESTQNDENYQLKYFGNRIMLALINAAGFVDVMTDITLGTYAILGQAKIIGTALVVLCIIDMIIMIMRVLSPEKLTLRIHVFTIVLELTILGVSLWITLLEYYRGESEFDVFGVAVLSIGSTLVNLIHHIIIVVIWTATIQQQKSQALSKFQIWQQNRNGKQSKQTQDNLTTIFS